MCGSLLATVISHPPKENLKGEQSREEQEDLGSPSAGGTGGGQGAGSEGNTKAEMGGTGGTMDGAGLRQTKLKGGWTVHKTQEDEEKKMRG